MSNIDQLETKRTFLRPLTIEDAKHFYNLNLDIEVLRFTGDRAFQSVDEAKAFLSNYDQYEKYGVGRLAVIDKESREFMGWCGLKFSPDVNEYDIGFRFFKSFWNQGFATETALKCLEFGFRDLHLEEIVGRAMANNKTSIKVLEKLGMTFKKTFDFDREKGVIYSIRKEDFIKKSPKTQLHKTQNI